MKPATLTVLLSTLASAASRVRQVSDGCCFGLTSVGLMNETVGEGHSGDLVLGGVFQQGGFCLDRSTKTIKDTLGHNCFLKDPLQAFECFSGLTGATSFDILPAGPNSIQYLGYDGGSAFYACPTTTGSGYYDIYSIKKADRTGCVPVALALHNPSPACLASTSAIASSVPATLHTSVSLRASSQRALITPSPTHTTTKVLSMSTQVSQASVLSSVSPSVAPRPLPTNGVVPAFQADAPSPVCSVAPNSPSLAPFKIGYPDDSLPDGVKDTFGEAAVSSLNTTILQYAIPNAYFHSGSASKVQTCALQFRMPVCSDLPKGYPCYDFSGMEQEVLSNSGMNVELLSDDSDINWNGTELHQVFPGENTILGTFDCSKPAGTTGAARKMSWRVSSVRGFSLHFLQAGIGSDAEYQDGVGAWIVACQ